MRNISFLATFFWGTQKRGLPLPGIRWCQGESGKAEAAKLPDARISLKQCLEERVAEKRLAY